MPEEQTTQRKGFRKGMSWDNVLKSLTPEDKERISLMKDIDSMFADDEVAKLCAVRSDQMYQQFDQVQENIEALVVDILSAKYTHDDNHKDITAGQTDKTYTNTNKPMTMRDLELENMILQRRIRNSIRKLWLFMADAYRYTETHRLDRQIFFSKKDYAQMTAKVMDVLKKANIDMFAERRVLA